MSTSESVFQKLDLIMRKGRMGPTMSRAETAERLNPLVEQHAALNYAYRSVQERLASERLADEEAAAELAALMKRARADVGKLKESIFSAGATAYNATEMDPAEHAVTGDDPLAELRERELRFHDAVAEEAGRNHQMRTRAILGVVQANSEQRLDFLKKHVPRR